MTGKERVLRAIQRKSIDRVPLDLWARQEVWDSLKKHFSVDTKEEVQQKLGLDVANLRYSMADPEFAARTKHLIPGSSTVSGALAIPNEDGTYTDQWGVCYGLDASESVDHIVSAPFKEAVIPEGYHWPSYNAIEKMDTLDPKIQKLHDKGFCVFGHILNPFKQAWQLRGFDDFLMDLSLNPDFAAELFDKLKQYSIRMARNLILSGADVICIVGDVAMQDRMFFNPDLFSKLLVPVYRAIIEDARKEWDIPFFFHSDGNIMPILGDLVEAGFTIVNPVQPESMDPIVAKQKYGASLTLHGLMSVQTVLPKGTEQEVRDTVRRYIDLCGQDGGLILCTTNEAMDDIPLNNLLAIYDEACSYSEELYAYQDYEERR